MPSKLGTAPRTAAAPTPKQTIAVRQFLISWFGVQALACSDTVQPEGCTPNLGFVGFGYRAAR